MLHDVIDIIKMRILDSPLSLVVSVDSRIPDALWGDAVRIRQIMLNILGNAVKYTKTGHVSLSVRHENLNDDTLNLIIEIADSGRGIKEEDLALLFDEFSQFDLEKNKGIEGTGLGLAITHSLVMGMGGDIHVSSQYNKGSTFTVSLPQTVRSREMVAEVKDRADKRVLIFEKRDILKESLIQTLSGLNVAHKCVSSAPALCLALANDFYTHIFAAAALYENDKELFAPLEASADIALIAEFGETVAAKDHPVIVAPIYSIPAANLLNGVDNRSAFSENEPAARFIAPAAKVLVVDDVDTNLQVAEGLMQPYQMQVDLCGSGHDAIEAIAANRYDLIFMDQMMPEMSGIEAVARIRAKNEPGSYFINVPIVALTANVISGNREMLLENGFNDFLSKPMDVAKLNAVLEKWIPKDKQKRTGQKAAPPARPKPAAADKATGITADQATEKSASAGTDKWARAEIAGIDIKEGIARSGGSSSLYHNILGTFCKDVYDRIEHIKNSFDKGDLPLYTIHVHALKSACATIGAAEHSKAAAALESAGRNGDHEFIAARNQPFTESLTTLLGHISLFLAAKT